MEPPVGTNTNGGAVGSGGTTTGGTVTGGVGVGGTVTGGTITGTGLIRIVRAWLAIRAFPSVTVMVKLTSPMVVGCPLMTPVDSLRVSPSGRVPLVTA